MAAAPAIKLEYFPIEGAGEKVRLALALTETAYEDSRIFGEAWEARKASCKYGQMPILTVGGVEKYQSTAQLKFIGRSFGGGALYPEGDPEASFKIDEAIELVGDIQRAWLPCLYISMYPERFGHKDITDEAKDALVRGMREQFLASELPKLMGFMTNMLNENGGQFIAGASPTVADCAAVPAIRYFSRGVADHVPANCLEPYPEVLAYVERFMALPAVAAHYAPSAPST